MASRAVDEGPASAVRHQALSSVRRHALAGHAAAHLSWRILAYVAGIGKHASGLPSVQGNQASRAAFLRYRASERAGRAARTEWGSWGPASKRVGERAGAKPLALIRKLRGRPDLCFWQVPGRIPPPAPFDRRPDPRSPPRDHQDCDRLTGPGRELCPAHRRRPVVSAAKRRLHRALLARSRCPTFGP